MTTQHTRDIKSNLSMLHAHLDGFMATTLANVYCKDVAGKYLDANELQVARSGVQSSKNLIGATDNDLSWKEFAPALKANDNRVRLQKQATLLLEPVKILNPQDISQKINGHYLSYKSPLLSRCGKVIGVLGFSYLLDYHADSTAITNEIAIIAGKETATLARKLISQNQLPFNLSKRQLDCLQLLVKGMSIKKMAAILSLSPRTVEHYLDTIKVKLSCSTRFELITKAFSLGLNE